MRFIDAVEDYTEYLLKLSYLYVKDRQLAEDIVQEVFVKLYEKHGETLKFEQTKSYIVQMTINRCRDYFRSWHYRKVQVMDLFDKREQMVTHDVQDEEIVEEVLQLPLKYREIVILFYYDDRTTAEIAAFLKLPIGTVKTRLQKARSLLKNMLKEGENHYEQQA